MQKARSKKNPSLEDELPEGDIVIHVDGEALLLRFTMDALATARTQLRKLGININLITSLNLGDLDADTVRPLFFAALLDAQPDMSYEKAKSMVRFDNHGAIYAGICAAYMRAMKTAAKEPSESHPPVTIKS